MPTPDVQTELNARYGPGPYTRAEVSAQQAIDAQVNPLKAAHGNLVNSYPLDPQIPDPNGSQLDPNTGQVRTAKVANPTPTTRYLYADGTYVDIRTDQSGTPTVLGGTAMKGAATGGGKTTLFQGPDGAEYTYGPDGTQQIVPGKSEPMIDGQPVSVWSAQRQASLAQQTHDLQALVAAGNLSDTEARNRLSAWYQENVDTPLKVLAAKNQQETFGYQAGQDAVQREMKLLPNRVSPQFAPQMANAMNILATGHGGNLGFTPQAFTFQPPDWNSIASKAMAGALAHISPVAASLTGAQPPQMPQNFNLQGYLSQLAAPQVSAPPQAPAAPAAPVQPPPAYNPPPMNPYRPGS